MQPWYPRSFLKLILVGFTLVAVPLIAALASSAVSVDLLAGKSQRALYQAVQAAQGTRALGNALTAMERSVRQSMVLQDPALLEGFFLAHERFTATAQGLERLPLPDELRLLLADMRLQEEAVAAHVDADRASLRELGWTADAFPPLAEAARQVVGLSSELIDREAESMRAISERAQSLVFWQLLALVPVALFLVAGFTVLIARPIRQIEEAIHRIGGGELVQAVTIDGPEDLRHIGERLDWMRARLVELEEQKAKFLRHMSHELKTPLTALREGAELLCEGAAGPLTADQQEIAQILRTNGRSLQKLIEDLLNYGAVQGAAPALVTRPVRLRELVSAVADAQRMAMRAKDLKFQCDCADIELDADEDKLRTIVDNLISNAVKFSPPAGIVRVSVRTTAGEAVLEVSDEGPGVAPDERGRVFEAFYRGRAPGSGQVKGTGLGLSIVRDFVAAHRGRVDIVDLPQGACFRVSLPLGGPS